MNLQQELDYAAERHKIFVCYLADIERIIRKWGVTSDITRYIQHQALDQVQFGEKIGIKFELDATPSGSNTDDTEPPPSP